MGNQVRSEAPAAMDLTEAVGFFSWNVQQNQVYGDKVFAYIYGLDHQHLEAGAPIEQVVRNIDDCDVRRVAKTLHETIISGQLCNQTYRVTHPDGRKIVVTGRGRCLRDATGVPSIYTGTVWAAELNGDAHPTDPLESHCWEALKIAKSRRHALAARYLSSALNAIGGKVDH